MNAFRLFRSLLAWCRPARSLQTRTPARRSIPLHVEALEDRQLLSGIGKQQFLGSILRHHGVIESFPPPIVAAAPASLSGCVYADLNNNGHAVTTVGSSGYADDALGFGDFPGQHAIALFSKYPILDSQIRSFQFFKWKDMPGNLLTNDAALSTYYSADEQAALRLSSKNHLDVPIDINGRVIHFLLSHPTPPVFDSVEDRNGKRNHDEIRFWRDYITPGSGNYIYDDTGHSGGLSPSSSFIILGDMNADPIDGDSFDHSIDQLLSSPLINTSQIPTSLGGPQQALLLGRNNRNQLGNPAFDTGDFNDFGPGNLRSDYILPWADLTILDSGIFWPLNSDPLFPLVSASDHRLVWMSIPEPASVLLLLAIFPWHGRLARALHHRRFHNLRRNLPHLAQ